MIQAKKMLKKFPPIRNFIHIKRLYKTYNRAHNTDIKNFIFKNYTRSYVQSYKDNKASQIALFLKKIDINPVKNDTFFYSIDCFKALETKNRVFDNYSVDYNIAVNNSLKDIKDKLLLLDNDFAADEIKIIDALQDYYKRCLKNKKISDKYSFQLTAIASLFERPANSFFEGLQRILFFNQFIWQTNHKNIGFGHLDEILEKLYKNDIQTGKITEKEAKDLLRDFFMVCHENYWFKSSLLLGDTGQIIILGGVCEDNKYYCNDLTYKFIEVSMELKLPDPKVLLRCSDNMPNDLLELALDCISTGIGAPLLSNDDAVIPALISFGYEKKDAYKYVTSACWEPLVAGESCDQNNIVAINYAAPFVSLMNETDLNLINSIDEFVAAYNCYLEKYLKPILSDLSKLDFEDEPLFSLLSLNAVTKGKDIVKGGAKYNNLGITTVGLGTVVNSIININKLVFIEKRYSLEELNVLRKNNFENEDKLLDEMKKIYPCFGCDDSLITELTKKIMNTTEGIFRNYYTKYGGKFKFGLSSPLYIIHGKSTEATLDGRKYGEPFSVHISSASSLPMTELLSFAMNLNYSGLKINGNVVDFIVTPSIIKNNLSKFVTMLKNAFKHGLYQLQMNVVDSATLIAAKKNPEKFPNLVVRVWGFSAYFNDLPDEYKDLLIQRALEGEQCA